MTTSFMQTLRSRDPVPESKFRWLGSFGGYRYATRDGQEFAVTQRPMDPSQYSLKPGEVYVARKVTQHIDGSPWTETQNHLAMPVESGSWAQIEKRLDRRRRKVERPVRVWSALVGLLGPKREKLPLVLGASANPDVGALQAATGANGGAIMVELEQATVELTPAGFIAYFEAKGHTFRRGKRDGNALIPEGGLPLVGNDEQIFQRVKPLLLMELGGPTVSCSDCAKPAVIPLQGLNAWACAEHRPQ